MSRVNYLEKSLSNYDQPYSHLASIVEEEVADNECELPLENFTSFGGWPDPQTLEVCVESIESHEDGLLIVVDCDFFEAMPTGCSDIRDIRSARGDLVILLDVKNDAAYVGEK